MCLLHAVTGFWRHLSTLHVDNEDVGWLFKMQSVSCSLQMLPVKLRDVFLLCSLGSL